MKPTQSIQRHQALPWAGMPNDTLENVIVASSLPWFKVGQIPHDDHFHIKVDHDAPDEDDWLDFFVLNLVDADGVYANPN